MATETTRAEGFDDGGDAFPQCLSHDGKQLWQSCDLYDDYGRPRTGMTLRDWFAGQALVGLLANDGVPNTDSSRAAYAYVLADAMLAARKAVGQ